MEERNRCKICHRNARNTAYLISYIAVCFECLKKFPKNSKKFPKKFFLNPHLCTKKTLTLKTNSWLL